MSTREGTGGGGIGGAGAPEGGAGLGGAGPVLSVRLLGRFGVERDGAVVEGWHAREAGRLLAFLLVAGRAVAADAVAAAFWPATRSQDSLRQCLRQARRALGEEAGRLDYREGVLSFDASGVAADLLAFRRLASAGDPASLRAAVALYGGPLLDGWQDDWVHPAREELARQYARALRELARTSLAGGAPAEAATSLRAALGVCPDMEAAWQDLIRAEALAGERVAALRTYENYRSYLRRQGGGLEPPEEVTALYVSLRETGSVGDSGRPAAPGTEPVGGAVALGSPFYVARDADAVFCPAVVRHDSLVLVKGPRQSGKSSLLARGLQAARHVGAATAAVDLEALGAPELVTLDTLCRCLAARLAAQLDLPAGAVPEASWQPLLAPGVNLERFLVRHVLGALDAPLAWALDGLDRLFGLPYGGEFFSLLRAWHEKRALEPQRPWHRLTLVLACATEAHLYVRDLNRSPFNVGTRVELADFTPEQVADLNRRHGAPLRTAAEVGRFCGLLGGHPYLVRRGLEELSPPRGTAPAELFAHAGDEAGPFGDHLRRLLRGLEADPELAAAARDALAGRPCPPDAFFRLRSAGVLSGGPGDGARPRCRLYAEFLAPRLRGDGAAGESGAA